MPNLDKQRIGSPLKGSGIEVMMFAAAGLRAPEVVIGTIGEAPEMKGEGVRVRYPSGVLNSHRALKGGCKSDNIVMNVNNQMKKINSGQARRGYICGQLIVYLSSFWKCIFGQEIIINSLIRIPFVV